MILSQTLRRAVQQNAKGTATVYRGRRQTWREFSERVARLAAGIDSLRSESKARVAILSLNSDRYLEYFYAVPWAGGVLNPVNIRLAPPEIAYALNDSGSSVLFVDDAFSDMLPVLRPLLETIEHVVFMGEGACPAGCIDYESLISASAPMEDQAEGGKSWPGCSTPEEPQGAQRV